MTDKVRIVTSTEHKMAATISSPNEKVRIYKAFFSDPSLTRLVVCGEGGTGKTIALKKACEESESHPPLQLIYTDEEGNLFPAKNSEAAVKTIVHCYSLDKHECSNETASVMFTGPFLFNASE